MKGTSSKTNPLTKAKLVVIKIGSALLVERARGEIRRQWLGGLIEDVIDLRKSGKEVVLVSSGSVALGKRVMGMASDDLRLEEIQAAAACGQIRLAHTYQAALAEHKINVAQILLTPADTEERQYYLNVRATLRNLLGFGTIPVINENDTVATPSRRFGDNDRLAARVAAMIDADCLILLSDIDGLYTADPTTDDKAVFIPEVQEISQDILAMAGDSRSGLGSGGMITKIEAARIAMNAGCAMAITKGDVERPINGIMKGAKCTWFVPDLTPAKARKIWIAGSLTPHGSLTIDAGAIKALKQGKSLLAAGVKKVEGKFTSGDPVKILSENGEELARGLVAYDSTEARKLMGHRSEDFEGILGYRGPTTLIHRDDMALL